MMIQESGSIWDYAGSGVIGIPTNGYINRNGAGVMGAGLAKDAGSKYPGIEYDLGTLIKREGNVVGWLRYGQIISIPVKPANLTIKSRDDMASVLPRARRFYTMGSLVPGFHCYANIKLIEESLVGLVRFIDKNALPLVAIPLLGCGNGGLSATNDLFPLLEKLDLPDSIILVIYTRDDHA